MEDIQELKSVCGEHAMKVILETGCLGGAADVKTASILAMYAGADYIKTSTEQAVAYYTIVKEVLGKEWLYTEFFRIGASSLANNILTDLTGKTVHLF